MTLMNRSTVNPPPTPTTEKHRHFSDAVPVPITTLLTGTLGALQQSPRTSVAVVEEAFEATLECVCLKFSPTLKVMRSSCGAKCLTRCWSVTCLRL